MNSSVENHAASYARARSDVENILVTDSRAEAVLTHRGGVTIVFDESGEPEVVFQFLFERERVPSGKVRRGIDNPGFRIQRAAASDADPAYSASVPSVSFRQRIQQACDSFKNGIGALMRVGGRSPVADKSEGGIEQCGGELGAADVERQNIL
jgi:hypothetical protein